MNAWVKNNMVMVDEDHSSQGIFRPGRPNRNIPSIITHFMNNVSESDSFDSSVQ